jgi:hypothetical protein
MLMAQLLQADPALTGGFLERNGAWRWLGFAMMWKLGTTHSYGIPRSMIEDRWRMDMEVIYNTFYLPATEPTHPEYMSDDSRCLRAFGQRRSNQLATNPTPTMGGPEEAYTVLSNGLAYYMGTVIYLMKTTGSWDRMYNLNDKCKKAMDFLVDCLDRFSIDFILDTDGRAEGYVRIAPWSLTSANNPSKAFATSWKDWNDNLVPRAPGNPEDWVRNIYGVPRGTSNIQYEGAERDVAQHNRAQWAFLRKDHLASIRDNPRINAAVTKYEEYYAYRAAFVAGDANPGNKRNRDWSYLIPPMGRIKPPTP